MSRDLDRTAESGYVALIDPSRLEFILEKCRPPMFVRDDGKPSMREPCRALLWGSILGADAETIRVRGRDGNITEVRYEWSEADQALSVEVGDHAVVLVAGRKNDLVQRLDRLPSVEKRREEAIRNMRKKMAQ